MVCELSLVKGCQERWILQQIPWRRCCVAFSHAVFEDLLNESTALITVYQSCVERRPDNRGKQ